MKINLSKKQYRDLVLTVLIGTYIRGGVDEQNGKDWKPASEIEDYLLSFAKDFDSEDLVQNFEGGVLPSDSLIEEYHEHYIEAYEEENFWHTLTTLLGQRDYQQNSTPDEREIVAKNDGWFGEIIDKYYEKYETEFEQSGIQRLIIDASKK